MRIRLSSLAAILGVLFCATGPTVAEATAASPCGQTTPTTYKHVINIVMENHAWSSVFGPSPKITALAKSCAYASNYHAVTHPSLPNYIALAAGSTHGITTDCSPASCGFVGSSVFGQAWDRSKVYSESMPYACDKSDAYPYMAKHNPVVYLRSLADYQCQRISTPYSAFGTALDAGNVPTLAYVIPNMCNDTHDCSITTGDNWVSALVTRITTSKEWSYRDTAIFITWDEAEGSSTAPIGLVVIAPTVSPGLVVSTWMNHYALLGMTEDMLAVPRLGGAVGAPSLLTLFHLR